MGLAEKKVIKEYQDKEIPEIETMLKAVVGTAIKIEVEWDSFTTADALKDLYGQGFIRAHDGIKRVAKDATGKEALAESVKVLKFINQPGGPKAMNVGNGVFSITGEWGGSLSGIFTDASIGEWLENNL